MKEAASNNRKSFLQKHGHCFGENAEALYSHLKKTKLKIKGFVIEPNSREIDTVVLSSFT